MAEPGASAKLVGKLPTFRGIAGFFYVAATWSRISDELETYRRQERRKP
jgi:hypothetical protein